jgi:outer membrane lipoprotein-sorting protein
MICLLVYLAFLFVSTNAQDPDGDTILKKVDKNLYSENKVVVSHMVIQGRRGNRTVQSKSWQRNWNESYTEYLAPAREKGTKMLKLAERLWMYSPSTDRTIMISGHMLRQSVMGSDLSYEDMMEDPLMQNLYTAKISGEETVYGRPCWILDLTAKKEDIAYHARKVWVDKERYLVMKEDLYAKSGKLLKILEVQEMIQAEGRWIAKKALYKDVLKEGQGTQFIVDSIEFPSEIPDHIFSKASLRK